MIRSAAKPIQTECVVVGTGPAGISVCWPLVEAGLQVLVLDAGIDPEPVPAKERLSLSSIREAQEARVGELLLGSEYGALQDVEGLSPKLRTAARPDLTAGYQETNRILVENFKLVGALAQGGLSNVWGAGVSLYDDDDLGGGPVRAQDLARSYQRVAERIGISGEADDAIDSVRLALQAPLPLSPGCGRLLERSRQRGQRVVMIGRPKNAVLTSDLHDRQACALDNMCMWGCAKRAVYCSTDELPRLRAHANFRDLSGFAVDAVRRDGDGYLVLGTDRRTGEPLSVSARKVILAAGTVPTTRLTMDLLAMYGRELALQSSPAASFAMLSPGRIGSAPARHGFSLAQLTISCDLDRIAPFGGRAFGSIFEAEGVSAADLAAQLPLTRQGAMAFVRHLLTALHVGLIYLPGEFSDTRVRLSQPDDTRRTMLSIRGGVRGGTDSVFRSISRKITMELLRCGVLVLPGSMRPMMPGAEVHYGASLPMGGELVSDAGELRAAPGVFIVDGAALPRVAAKHHTFTVMANADRIGRQLAMARAA